MKQSRSTVTALEILSNTPYSSHGRTISRCLVIELKCAEIAQEASPGQFVMVRCGKDTILPRPFTIHQLRNDKITLYLGVWEDGLGTNWILQRIVGDEVEIFGPLGKGFSISPNSHSLLLLAGGIGIAPLHFLAQEAINKGQLVTMIYGAQSSAQLYPEQRLPFGANLIAVTEDGSVGHKGLVTDLIPKYSAQADQIFACGPMPMYRDMALKKQELKLEGKTIQVSLEVRMGCGRGLCYGCTIKTKLGLKKVCQDGPVFDLDDILWDELSPL